MLRAVRCPSLMACPRCLASSAGLGCPCMMLAQPLVPCHMWPVQPLHCHATSCRTSLTRPAAHYPHPAPCPRSVQAVGIAIWASSQSSGTPDQGQIRLGCGITLAGLAIQLVCFLLFTALCAWSQRHSK